MLNRILISFAFLIIPAVAWAQVSVQFIPEVYGRSLDGLLNANLLNTGGKMNVRLSVSVTENKAGKILTIITPAFALIPGNNRIPGTAARSASIQMGNNSLSLFIQKNGYFPQGDYEYSYKVISAISIDEIIVDQLFEQEVSPPAPLNLIEPYNEDKICNKMPVLSWQPSIPTITGTMYELLLVEIKDRQSPVEALNYNLPVVKQKGIPNPILVYPASSKELTEGKHYAWQVTAYKDQTIINRSDVWEFTYTCKEEKVVVEDDNGYRDIDDLFRGNFYVAQGLLKFSVTNSYKEQSMAYTVKCLSDPDLRIRRLPKIKLLQGINKVHIDLAENNSFRDGYSYLLELQMPGGGSKKLRFVYKEGQ